MLSKAVWSICLLLLLGSSAQARELPDFTSLVEKQGAAVVNISTTQLVRGGNAFQGMPENDPFYEFFRRFGPQIPQGDREERSLGSGFIVSDDGYILTNAHVVDHADKVVVRLTDKREFKAQVIGVDRRTDVALLKIGATGLPKVQVGDPNALKPGEWVVAIGSPFGFDNSVTAGIVSAKGRTLPNENLVPFIQTDVAINPGNSGGPLFNMKGEVVGINSQIYTRSGGYMGVAFSIPIDVALNVSDQLRASGKVSRGRIGVAIEEVTRDKAESFGLERPQGALVSNVEKDGPADKAGIRFGDVILKFNGTSVASSAELPRLVGAMRPGSKVQVDVWRAGAVRHLELTVGKMPDEVEDGQQPGGEGASERFTPLPRMGVAVRELSQEQRQALQVSGGLLIGEVKSVAARSAGLQPGDVIVAIGSVEVKSVAQVISLFKQVPQGRNIALLIKRGEFASYVPIRLDEK
jgi:serine protease Do